MARAVAVLLVMPIVSLCLAENIDPLDDNSQYAYGENIGWLNAEPGGEGGEGVEVLDFQLTGWMWSENAGWISLSCENNGSCDDVQYGVANDGQGELSGLAWSENLGWIDFGAAGAGVLIDPTDGVFSGKAWSENSGWISFAPDSGSAYSMVTSWLCASPDPPMGVPELTLTVQGSNVQITWPASVNATAYDAVRSGLDSLREFEGDFSLSVDSCLGSKQAATTAEDDDPLSAGEGVWYLVRAANCANVASYDSGGPAQVASRDAGIDAAVAACP